MVEFGRKGSNAGSLLGLAGGAMHCSRGLLEGNKESKSCTYGSSALALLEIW